jgi:hypothetical protein
MITTVGEIKTQVLERHGVSTTAAFYTDTILNDYLKSAHRWATSFKKYPFTEGRLSTTFAGGAGDNDDEWSFEGYKSDSIRILTIGGKRHKKLNFDDYLIFREETPSAEDRVYSDYGRLVYINPRTDASGTLTVYGQFIPVDPDTTDPDSTTVFSNTEPEGNEAIIEEMLSFMNLRERKEDKAKFHHDRAVAILETIQGLIEDEGFNYHTYKTRDGMWERFDVLEGDLVDDLLNRDQF